MVHPKKQSRLHDEWSEGLNESNTHHEVDNFYESNSASKTSIKKQTLSDQDIADDLSSKFFSFNVFAVVIFILAVAIIMTGVTIVENVQQYRQDYTALEKLKTNFVALKIENQRLLIEQQTFSATPKVASRAITELKMFYPSINDKMIIQPKPINPSLSPSSPQNFSNQQADDVANSGGTP